jgi:hypothetical protein
MSTLEPTKQLAIRTKPIKRNGIFPVKPTKKMLETRISETLSLQRERLENSRKRLPAANDNATVLVVEKLNGAIKQLDSAIEVAKEALGTADVALKNAEKYFELLELAEIGSPGVLDLKSLWFTAAQCGNTEALGVQKKKGVDPSSINSDGHNALDLFTRPDFTMDLDKFKWLLTEAFVPMKLNLPRLVAVVNLCVALGRDDLLRIILVYSTLSVPVFPLFLPNLDCQELLCPTYRCDLAQELRLAADHCDADTHHAPEQYCEHCYHSAVEKASRKKLKKN